MNQEDIRKAIAILKKEVKKWPTPIVTQLEGKEDAPYQVLVSCILSLRTKDKTTSEAYARLYAEGNNPLQLSKLSVAKIEKLIYPVGFYRNKAEQLKEIGRVLVENYGSKIPDTIEELLKFKGVGRKTANLVVTAGYGKEGICVDTHVHRITNRWGYIKTKTPDETETALRKTLPKKYWLVINDLLVTFGQNHCKPVSPHCSTCKIAHLCPKDGVGKE
ncbi:MAG: endonuclease III [Nitrospinae bacterium]|nr:endonuclease III [Nitrospinota bacterium]